MAVGKLLSLGQHRVRRLALLCGDLFAQPATGDPVNLLVSLICPIRAAQLT